MTSADKKRASAIYQELAAVIEPKPELHFNTPFELLVAVVLSAQTTDKAVNAVTDSMFRSFRAPQDYIDLGEEGLMALIRSIGLYRNKSRSIIGLCHKLIDDFAGEVPQNLEALMSLPGVGRKTAYVVLNLAFRQPFIAVDTHIFRVAHRLKLSNAATPERTSDDLMGITPEKYMLDAHHYLLLHGRYTCTARNPKCSCCVLKTAGLCKGEPI